MTTPAERRFIRERLTTPFRRRQKLSLAFEILGSYARQRRRLRRSKLPDVLAELRRPLANGGAERRELDDQLTGIRLGRAVGRTLTPVPDARCLLRSLVLVRLLARQGIQSRLVIGITSLPRFAAHAWVETGGTPLLPTQGLVPSYDRLIEL